MSELLGYDAWKTRTPDQQAPRGPHRETAVERHCDSCHGPFGSFSAAVDGGKALCRSCYDRWLVRHPLTQMTQAVIRTAGAGVVVGMLVGALLVLEGVL